MESADEVDVLLELAEHYRKPCEERMTPIPGQSWRCVLPDQHGDEGHMAEDGTAW